MTSAHDLEDHRERRRVGPRLDRDANTSVDDFEHDRSVSRLCVRDRRRADDARQLYRRRRGDGRRRHLSLELRGPPPQRARRIAASTAECLGALAARSPRGNALNPDLRGRARLHAEHDALRRAQLARRGSCSGYAKSSRNERAPKFETRYGTGLNKLGELVNTSEKLA